MLLRSWWSQNRNKIHETGRTFIHQMEVMMGVSEPLPEAITRTIGPPPAKGLALVLEWLRVSKSAVLLIFEGARLGLEAYTEVKYVCRDWA